MKMAAFVIAVAFAALLAEDALRSAKKAAETKAEIAWCRPDLAASLRATFHDKERAFTSSKAKRRAAKCTRRASKTHGILRESLARCLETPRYRVVYCHATRTEALGLAWRGDTRDGWRDLVEDIGLRIARTRKEFEKGDADCLTNETELTIDFRNGSQLSVFCADRDDANDKLRGKEKHLVIVDEAQKYKGLSYAVDDVMEPLLAKPIDQEQGELWLTGTPSRNLDGLFFEVTCEPEQGDRLEGWEVHEFSVIDNPYFGATPEERWAATAGAFLTRKGWSLDKPPPQFVREYLGKWTTGDALYVYAVHAVPPATFAPVRVDATTGVYDHAAAFADLPRSVVDDRGVRVNIEWYFTMGVDFGFLPDPFAWVVEAWSPQIEDVYEMASWKSTEVIPDRMRDLLVGVWDQVKDRLVSIRGDSGGAAASALIAGWEEVLKLPIEPADRHGKDAWQELYNGEIYSKRKHYREGSALLDEQRNLQWRLKKNGKREEWADRTTSKGVKPGNHLCDADLYAWRDIAGRRTDFEAPPSTDEQRDARMLADIDRQMAADFDEGRAL